MTAPNFSDASAAKLRASGIEPAAAPGLGIRPVTTAADLPDEFRTDPRATVPGMVVDWATASGTVPQYRPDAPREDDEGRALKYLFPADDYVGVSKVGRWPERVDRVLVVEGSLQSRSVAQWVDGSTAVLATPGCWGWSHEQLPSADLAAVDGAEVLVILDADASTNLSVFNAGTRLASVLVGMGAESVSFPRLGLARTQGVDDLLGARATDAQRRTFVEKIPDLVPARRDMAVKPADAKPKARPQERTTGEGLEGLPPVNDTDLAIAWAQTAAERFCYLPEKSADGTWRAYDPGTGWWRDTSSSVPADAIGAHLRELAQDHFTKAKDPRTDAEQRGALRDVANGLLTNDKLSSVLGRARRLGGLHVAADEFDARTRLWCAGNGVVDLMTGEFGEHRPEYGFTGGSTVDFRPDATCPRFDTYMTEAVPDPEVRAYLMRLMGVAMFGEVRGDAHVFPVLVGDGRNGKGAFVRIMQALFGGTAVAVDPRALTERKGEQHSQEIAKLRGKRLATTEETGRHTRWNVERIKSWTGGDRLTGRLMRENDDEFAPSHLLLMTTNERPNVDPGVAAFWMRYREIPFTESFEGREDPELEPQIIAAELPGVLNRVLAGVADYLAHGLAEPVAVLVSTKEARSESEHLVRFAEQCLRVTDEPGDRVANVDIERYLRETWWPANVGGLYDKETPRIPTTNQLPRHLRNALGNRWTAAENPRPDLRLDDGRKTNAWVGLRWADGYGPSSEDGGLDAAIRAL